MDTVLIIILKYDRMLYVYNKSPYISIKKQLEQIYNKYFQHTINLLCLVQKHFVWLSKFSILTQHCAVYNHTWYNSPLEFFYFLIFVIFNRLFLDFSQCYTKEASHF